jgi:Mg/Co/Ni transporter MgtE
MDETSTKFLNAITNDKTMVEGLDVTEYVDADELLFHHAIRAELDALQKQPKKQTIENLLSYSKSLR